MCQHCKKQKYEEEEDQPCTYCGGSGTCSSCGGSGKT